MSCEKHSSIKEKPWLCPLHMNCMFVKVTLIQQYPILYLCLATPLFRGVLLLLSMEGTYITYDCCTALVKPLILVISSILFVGSTFCMTLVRCCKTEALRRDLSGVVATRALYLAGEDDRGRQLVVFAPDLVAGCRNTCSFSERKNYTCMDTSADLEHVPEGRAAGADGTTAASCPSHSDTTTFGSVDSSTDLDEAGELLPSSRATHSVEGDTASLDAATMFSGTTADSSGANPHDFPEAGRTSLVAGERNVGSVEMENLLLYFVRLMDKVVEREYILLLLCPEGKDDARGGGTEGWVTWGRFSLLGQMHSLLPRR